MLALLEEADKISSFGTDSDSDTVSIKHKRNKQKDDKLIKKKVRYSIEKIKNKLLEERSRCRSRTKDQRKKCHPKNSVPSHKDNFLDTDEEREIHDLDSTDSEFTSKSSSQ